MTRIVIGPQADVDIQEILERLFELAGIGVAERYAADLQAIQDRLSMFPAIGA